MVSNFFLPALQLVLLLVHGELNGREPHAKKLGKIFCEKIAPFSGILAHLELFDRRLFSPRAAQENVFFLQVNVDFIEQPTRVAGSGSASFDDESSAAPAKASSQKACFSFVYTPGGLDTSDSSSAGGGGSGHLVPSPLFGSSMRPPLHSSSPGRGIGMCSVLMPGNLLFQAYPGRGLGTAIGGNRQQTTTRRELPTFPHNAVGPAQATAENEDDDDDESGLKEYNERTPASANPRHTNATPFRGMSAVYEISTLTPFY